MMLILYRYRINCVNTFLLRENTSSTLKEKWVVPESLTKRAGKVTMNLFLPLCEIEQTKKWLVLEGVK